MSSRASSCLLVVFLSIVSPDSGFSWGSTRTSLQISERRLAVKSGTVLWRRVTNPPFLHDNAWSELKKSPEEQVFGSRSNWCPYRIFNKSQNDCLSIWNPSSLRGRVDSHKEAPYLQLKSQLAFSFSVLIFLILSSFFLYMSCFFDLKDDFSWLISFSSVSFCHFWLMMFVLS